LGGRISNENGRPLAAFLYNEATSTGSGRHLRFEPFTILDVSIIEDFNNRAPLLGILTRGCLKGYTFVTEHIITIISSKFYGEEGLLFGNVGYFCILIGLFARW
jgi:hypothetical protein